MTRREIGLLGVPSSAGAHWPGQEKAPRAQRSAGS
jgi:arginase